MLKTIVAFSDSHGLPILPRLAGVIEESSYVFFLGDGLSRLGNITLHKGFYAVKGNCDSIPFAEEAVVQIDGIRFLLTHGDKYKVKKDLLALSLRAEELNCSVVFYGHTHFAAIDEFNGITFICPGSLCNSFTLPPSYVYATVYNGKFNAKIVNLI